jgi:uncharacterized protein
MAHDVFISYSSKDKPTADAVCATLESEGIRCWIAPRDVTPSMEWGSAIIDAIKNAHVMVLVFSANANSSPQIRREVERAVNHNVAILPFRVENIMPDETLEYFISDVHWLDALNPPLESHIKTLAGTIKGLLASAQTEEARPEPLAEPTQAMPAAAPPIAAASPAGAAVPLQAAGAQVGVGGPQVASGAPIARSRKIPVWVWVGAAAIVVLAAALLMRSGRKASTAGASTTDLPAATKEATDQANQLMSQKRYAEAKPLAEEACEDGSTGACYILGQLYDEGWSVAQDEVKASSLFLKACNGGQPGACTDLGILYDDGRGVGKDTAQALSYFQMACNGGNSGGCFDLGLRYENGDGIPKDYVKAAPLYQKACDWGNSDGCNNLGMLYLNGLGVTKDYAQATPLFEKACNGGDMAGCGNLGLVYVRGYGVTASAVKGKAFFRQACNGGDDWSCTQLKRME